MNNDCKKNYCFIKTLGQTDDQAIFDIGVDDSCDINDVKIYCNGPLRPGTDYRMKLRVFTDHGFQDSWTVPFTTRE